MSMENRFCKVELMMNSIIVTVILLITAIFFWPSSSNTQSNPNDKTKTHIKALKGGGCVADGSFMISSGVCELARVWDKKHNQK